MADKKPTEQESALFGRSKTDRLKAIGSLCKELKKDYGLGTLEGKNKISRRDAPFVIPTGSIGLDIALGINGYPGGRIVEIYGPEASGKTTLTLHAIARAQEMGMVCAFVDAEHALDPTYAQALGVNLEELLIDQPDSAEQALELVDQLVRSEMVGLIVVDSVAALVPEAELDGDMGDSLPGLQARLMSQACRKLTGIVGKCGCTVIFINQIRHKIGVKWGSPETTSGGNALKFYASVRLDIRRIGSIKKGEDVIGNRTKVTVKKNKFAPPFRKTEFDIRFGVGIDRMAELLDYAVAADLVQKKGSWYNIGDEKLGQGRDRAIKALGEREDLQTIRERLMESLDAA